MLQAVLNALFPCVHRRTTFPRSHGRAPAGTPPGAYVVCLDCGRVIPYNLGWTKPSPPAALAAEAKGRQRRESARGDAARAQREPEAIQAQSPPETAPATQPPLQLDATPAAEANGEPEAIQAKALPDTTPVTQPPPRLDVTPAAEASGEPPAALPAGSGDGLAAGIPPVASQPERGSSLTDESVCFTLPSKDSHANGAGDSACRLPARPEQPDPQPIAPTAALTEAAFPAVPVFLPSLFSTSESGVAEAPNGAHSTIESDARRYLERAGLRSRKVQVALRVLNSLMAGNSAQPGDVAQLVSWADPSNRGRSIGELAREVVEWAGSC